MSTIPELPRRTGRDMARSWSSVLFTSAATPSLSPPLHQGQLRAEKTPRPLASTGCRSPRVPSPSSLCDLITSRPSVKVGVRRPKEGCVQHRHLGNVATPAAAAFMRWPTCQSRPPAPAVVGACPCRLTAWLTSKLPEQPFGWLCVAVDGRRSGLRPDRLWPSEVGPRAS